MSSRISHRAKLNLSIVISLITIFDRISQPIKQQSASMGDQTLSAQVQ